MTAKRKKKKSTGAKPKAAKEAAAPQFGIADLGGRVDPELIFRFQLGPAMLDQLRAKLESLPTVALTADVKAPHAGFYQIIYDGKPRYIGKAKSRIASRLRKHFKTLSRLGADPKKMKCRFAFVEDLSLVDMTEQALIAYFGERGESEWNGSGMGSNVTGYRRGGQLGSAFFKMFDPDPRREVPAGSDDPITFSQLIRQLDGKVAYDLKIPTDHKKAFAKAFPDSEAIPEATRPFEDWVKWLEKEIAPNWKIERREMSWYVVPK